MKINILQLTALMLSAFALGFTLAYRPSPTPPAPEPEYAEYMTGGEMDAMAFRLGALTGSTIILKADRAELQRLSDVAYFFRIVDRERSTTTTAWGDDPNERYYVRRRELVHTAAK